MLFYIIVFVILAVFFWSCLAGSKEDRGTRVLPSGHVVGSTARKRVEKGKVHEANIRRDDRGVARA